MKKEKTICDRCQKTINLNSQKYVLLGTYQNKKALEEKFFHWKCFLEWHESKITEKVENHFRSATKNVMKMVGGIIEKHNEPEQLIDFNKEIPQDLF